MSDQDSLILEVGSVEEAQQLAAETWSLQPEDVVVKVLEEEKSFFGLFGRKLRVEARPLESLQMLRGRNFVGKLVDMMDLDISVDIADPGRINLSGDDAGIVIGKYGETLKSLEYVVNLMLRNDSPGFKVRLDSDGYRERRENSLVRLAHSAAKQALRARRTIYLESMTSWERRIVHIALKQRGDVETRSVGVEPERKVAIRPLNSRRRTRPGANDR